MNNNAQHFSIPVRVYIEDTDAGGIVYYVNYLKYMERCRTEFLRRLGYDKPAILNDGKLLVVHKAEINYQRAARLDDEIEITAVVTKLARSYVEFEQNVTRGNELLCVGLIRIVCVQPATMKPCAMPADMYGKLSELIG